MHHTKLQINGPSGHCSHLDFHPPPEVQQPSPVDHQNQNPFRQQSTQLYKIDLISNTHKQNNTVF